MACTSWAFFWEEKWPPYTHQDLLSIAGHHLSCFIGLFLHAEDRHSLEQHSEARGKLPNISCADLSVLHSVGFRHHLRVSILK